MDASVAVGKAVAFRLEVRARRDAIPDRIVRRESLRSWKSAKVQAIRKRKRNGARSLARRVEQNCEISVAGRGSSRLGVRV